MSTTSIADLRSKIAQERKATPNIRARDLAERLDISEAELVCSGLGITATRLTGPWSEVITALVIWAKSWR